MRQMENSVHVDRSTEIRSIFHDRLEAAILDPLMPVMDGAAVFGLRG
jgi:hypothetical protein